MTDRRNFLALAAGAAVIASPLAAEAQRPARRRATGPAALRGMIVVNGLGGFSERPKDIADMLASGTTAVNMTVADVGEGQRPPTFETSVEGIAKWLAIVRRHPDQLLKVETVADIRRARDEGKIGVVFGLQNSAEIGERLERIDIFADMGLKAMQLTYNVRNQLGGGSLDPANTGLTPFGREAMERMHARKLMVDLSHSGQRICLDAARASSRPICISHTGCSALNPNPRNKTDEELRAVTDKGGYVGIYFMPFLATGRRITGDDVVAHIEHALKVCGEDHVGIGTDNGVSAIENFDAYMVQYAKIVMGRRAAGISAPGEDPLIPRIAADLDGPHQFGVIAEKLARRGHSWAKIEKVMSGNYIRYAQGVWG